MRPRPATGSPALRSALRIIALRAPSRSPPGDLCVEWIGLIISNLRYLTRAKSALVNICNQLIYSDIHSTPSGGRFVYWLLKQWRAGVAGESVAGRGLALLPKHPGAFFHDLLPKLFTHIHFGRVFGENAPESPHYVLRRAHFRLKRARMRD